MTLSSLVVSRDWQEISVLECILGALQMQVAVEKEPQRALSRISKSKVDALIVDCDLNGANQLFCELRRDASRNNSIPLVVMSARPQKPAMEDTGALFAFDKPISVEQAVRTLSAARNMILDGRLRYHRAGLDVPVTLTSRTRRRATGQLINLSQGGLQVRLDSAFDPNSVTAISFELPGSTSEIKAQAHVAWSDNRGNVGVRFSRISAETESKLRLWLAQQYFAN